jgi:hypothetical protein
MFQDFNVNDPQLADLQAQADELRARLLARKHFSALPPKQQKRFLTGHHAWLVIQDDLLARMDVNVGSFRGYYRFLSSHMHSFPLAFYRMPEREQGRGLESDWEKGMISIALEFAVDALRRATKDMYRLFPDIAPEVESPPAV